MSWSGFRHGGVDYANYAGTFDPRVFANRGIDFAVVKVDGGGRERSPQTHPWAAEHVPRLIHAGVPYTGGYCVTRPGKIPEQVGYALDRMETLFGGLAGHIVQQDVEKWDDAYGTPTYAECVRWAELWHEKSDGHPLALYFPRWVHGIFGGNLKNDWPPGTVLWASDYSAKHVQEKLRPYGGFDRVGILQYSGSTSIAGVKPIDANLINAATKTEAYAFLDRLSGKTPSQGDDMDQTTDFHLPANIKFDEWPAGTKFEYGELVFSILRNATWASHYARQSAETMTEVKELLAEIRDRMSTPGEPGTGGGITEEDVQRLADGLGAPLATAVTGALKTVIGDALTAAGDALEDAPEDF